MEVALIIGVFVLILAYRWFNRSFKYMVHGIATLTQEAERFNKEENSDRI